jgi:hypothetical protein
MKDISRRVKNIEEKLNFNEEQKTLTIIQFGGQLPPDRIEGNRTIHFVMYDDIATENNQKQLNSRK